MDDQHNGTPQGPCPNHTDHELDMREGIASLDSPTFVVFCSKGCGFMVQAGSAPDAWFRAGFKIREEIAVDQIKVERAQGQAAVRQVMEESKNDAPAMSMLRAIASGTAYVGRCPECGQAMAIEAAEQTNCSGCGVTVEAVPLENVPGLPRLKVSGVQRGAAKMFPVEPVRV